MFGEIDRLAGRRIAGFNGGSRVDGFSGMRNDSGAINRDGVIWFLPLTPSQVIGAVNIGC